MNRKRAGYILGTKISTLSFQETTNLIDKWIKERKSRYVCVCNTHSLVTTNNSKKFKEALEQSNLCIPDGMPLVFALRRLGFYQQERVDGPNLMLKLCESAVNEGYRIFLYGNTEKNLQRLKNKLTNDYPGITIVGSISPPFRTLKKEEEIEIEKEINDSHADLVFVSLGCPKQELWMNDKVNTVQGVMIGVGAAFEFILGDIKRPPLFFQQIGLEWCFRLIAEPKRLFKRYAYNNPAFIISYIKTHKKDREKTSVQ